MTPDPTTLLSEKPDNPPTVNNAIPGIARMAAWDFAGRFANFGVLFAISVILTRLLTPSQFGAFAVVLALIGFSSIFIDIGFRSAIVQRQDLSSLQLSTVFYINAVLGAGLILIFWLAAPYFESFYEISGLSSYIRSTSIIFGINALGLVPSALLQKELRLKAVSVINTVAAAISGGIAVTLAFSGYGVWALVAQQIILAGLTLTCTVITAKWLPILSFSFPAVSDLLRYGSRLFASGILDNVFTRLDVFIIGKLFPIQQLGFYNRAQSLDGVIRTLSSATTAAVAFPVIARMADDRAATTTFYVRCLHIISFLAFGTIGVLFLGATDIITILFGEQWLLTAVYFRIMAVTAFVYPISVIMVNLIAARGSSGEFLKLEIIKKAVLIPAYLTFFSGSVIVFLAALGLVYLISVGLNARFVQNEIGLSWRSQLKNIYKYGLAMVATVAIVLPAGIFITNTYLHLVLVSLLAFGLYLLICYTFRLSGFLELRSLGSAFFNAKRNANISPAA